MTAQSSSRDFRHPLLHEGRHAFAIIVANPELAHPVALQVQLLVERMAPAFADHCLDRRQALRRRGGETCRQCRSEEHTSELQSLIRISYAVFCLNKTNNHINYTN